jgi:uncharacterized protein (TIGR02301 family)
MRSALVLLLLALAVPASAQERSAAQRETLVELAGVLGEAHALRQACGADPVWKRQFEQMLDVEQPDEDFAKQMQGAFNGGFRAHRNDFSACTPEGRMAEAEAALRGRELAAGLSRATVRVVPDDVTGDLAEPLAEGDDPR